MHEKNMKQSTIRQMPRSGSVKEFQPSIRKDELSILRARLFLKHLLCARKAMTLAKRTMTVIVVGAMAVIIAAIPTTAAQQSDAGQAALQTPAELQQLVAPFALYPDALVAQILAASTYPTQIVEAERWLQKHSNLEGEALANEVDKESWDPSVKALTQFPSVLAKMNESLSWTSAVGDAYFNQPQDVLDAIQVMRKRAEDAGTLQTTPQETVTTQGSTIILEPTDPNVCYLPIYDPWTVYGTPLAVYPGYVFDPWVGPSFYFGPAIGLGFFAGYGWGWPFWGFNWGRRELLFHHDTFVSRSPSFFHRFGDRGGEFGRRPDGSLPGDHHHDEGFDHNRHDRGNDNNHGDAFPNRDFGRGRGDDHPNPDLDRRRGANPSIPNDDQNHRTNRGFEGPAPGTRSGAFGGIGQGGIERGFESRGQSSFGRGGFGGGRGFGGGGMRGGGGGGHR
jgi:uncharacterized membrane protein YgcG